jgi:hypothetical protein
MGRILRLWEPRNRFQGLDYASLCSLAGHYDNPICCTGYVGWRNRYLGSLNVYKFGLRKEKTKNSIKYYGEFQWDSAGGEGGAS